MAVATLSMSTYTRTMFNERNTHRPRRTEPRHGAESFKEVSAERNDHVYISTCLSSLIIGSGELELIKKG